MRKLFFVVMCFAMVSSTAIASPFLVCDPNPDAEFYRITGADWITADIPAEADGSLRADMAQAPQGMSSLAVVACNTWDCSTSSPFVFTRQPAPSSSVGLRLTP